MILHEFPELQWLKKQAETRFANKQAWQGSTLEQAGWPTVVLNVSTAHTFRDNIRGPISLFTNMVGTSRVHIQNKVSKIGPNFFFLSNADQHYTLDIGEKEKTETFNIHFGEYWADQALRAMTAPIDVLLEEAVFTRPLEQLQFHNKLYEKTAELQSLLLALKACKDQKLKEDEKLFDILVFLLRTRSDCKRLESSLPPVKTATRQEIVRRLYDTTDYIYSNLNNEITLDALASVACLSKFHFLRLFKAAFNKTPNQFVTELRIREATSLLTKTSLEVKMISHKLGFRDASSFSRLYFNQTGLYPSQVR